MKVAMDSVVDDGVADVEVAVDSFSEDFVADVKVAMHSFFEDGEFVDDGLYDKFVIHVTFTQKNVVKAMGCMWDSDRSIWYSNKSNYCYTNGSLSQYLYLIILNNVRYPFDNPKVKKFGARWNPDIKRFWVFFQNTHFLDGSLDRFHPSRNG